MDTSKTIRFRAFLVSQTNIDIELGELTGIDWEASSITCGYYTDTRTAGALSVVGGGWVRGSFVRIYKDDDGALTEIGTYAVASDDADRTNGQWTTRLELISMLHTLSLDIAPTPKVIGVNGSVLEAMRGELEAAGRQYSFAAAADTVLKSVNVLESGKSRLSRLYELASMSGNRLDVDPHGRVIVSRYIAPRDRTAEMTLSLTDPHGVVFDGVSRSSNWLSTPSISVVVYKYTEERDGEYVENEISASVSVEATDHGSLTQRGYNITKYTELSSLASQSQEALINKAKDVLSASASEKTEWTMTTKYLPVWEGSVIEIDIPDGENAYTGVRHCLVKNIDISLGYGDMAITLKETSGGDDE